jgi:2-polyprenyl-3-methyl-5-hydroxy-6-metoxy-1,4-benzoquinol methylase
MEEVVCNLCGSARSDPVYTLTDTLYKIPGQFTLRRCQECGLMYLSPRPTPESIKDYYPPEYSAHRWIAPEDESSALMAWMRRRKLIKRRCMIERYSGFDGGRVLDVGCATGIFLHEMQLAGWQATGVEPNVEAAAYARQRFGLEVFEGMLDGVPFPKASFDVVTFWDVLEHTYSAVDDLTKVARLIRPGGLLVITVPNWDSFDRKLLGRFWIGFDCPRHLYVFTRSTFKSLLSQTKFTVLDWVCFVPGYFSTILGVQTWLDSKKPKLSQRVMRALNFPGARLIFEPWFMTCNWLGRGPSLTVFARRNND